MYTNRNIRWLALFMSLLLLHVPKLRSQTPGIVAGNTELSYTNTMYFLNMESAVGQNGQDKDVTFKKGPDKGGIKANVGENGYVQVDVSLDIYDWQKNDGKSMKEQTIYSVGIDKAGSHTTPYYNFSNTIPYMRYIDFHWIYKNEVTTKHMRGDNIHNALMSLRSTYPQVCAMLMGDWYGERYNPSYSEDDSWRPVNYRNLENFLRKLNAVLWGCDYYNGGALYKKIPRLKIKVTLRNATFYEFDHYLLGSVTASNMIVNTNGDHPVDLDIDISYDGISMPANDNVMKDFNVYVYDHVNNDLVSISTSDGNVNSHFNTIYKVNSIRTPYFRTKADTVAAYMGDRMIVLVRKQDGNNNKPVLTGIPGVHISPFNSTMQFICSPSVQPGEYKPFIPWESQTHQKNLNKLPPNFIDTIPDWKIVTSPTGVKYWVWSWPLQREQTCNKDKYRSSIVFPNTKTYADGHTQRSEQSAGHQAEFIHYWKKGNTNNVYTVSSAGTAADRAAPKYTLTTDPDEILYDGSYKMYQKPISANTNLIVAPVFTQVISPTKDKKLIAWQNMWPEELKSFSFDSKGFPSGGFLYNDYITEYRKYREYNRGNRSYNTYYNGYLIEDYDTYRNGTPSGTSVNPYRSNLNLPPDTCKENVWYNPMLATQNNTNPGEVSISYGGKTSKVRLHVVNLIRKQDGPKGFYGTIEGTNNPLGWESKNTYTIKGLGNLTVYELMSLSLKVIAYKPSGDQISQGHQAPIPDPTSWGGRSRRDVQQQWLLDRKRIVNNPYNVEKGQVDPYGGVPYVESEYKIDPDDALAIQLSGCWKPEVKFQGGQSVLALCYRNYLGEEVILAGRNIVVQDPTMYQFAAPGSSSYPYSKTSFVGQGEIDLKEGEGEKVNEFLNDYRRDNDPTNGYFWATPTYPAQRKFVKTYVLIKGQKVTFTTRDIGIGKTELFMNGGAWPWSGYYDMSRFMPQDSVNKYMKYTIHRLTDDYTLELGSAVQTFSGKNLTYTWNEVGDFAIKINFMGSDREGYVRVKVKDYPTDALADLTRKDKQRGTVVTRRLTPQEMKWIMKYSTCQNPIFTISSFTRLMLKSNILAIATIEDVPSLYKFNSGPRATSYGDRFGEFNDYNNKYKWYGHMYQSTPQGTVKTPTRPINGSEFDDVCVKLTPLSNSNDYLHQTLIDSIMPPNWHDIFLRHCSSNHFPTEDVDETSVLSNAASESYKTAFDNIFTTLSNQSELAYMRIFPWIAKTPSDGYKIFNFNKGVTDLTKFFNGSNNLNGAWSGKPYVENIPYVQTRMQMSYKTLSDDDRNFLEFYNNLYYGRSIIYNTFNVYPDSVYNINPKSDPNDLTKPDSIFIAAAPEYLPPNSNKTLNELFRNTYRVFEASSKDNGLYLENYNPNNVTSTKTSPSVNGMGLIALCIAHRMKWDVSAEEHAEKMLVLLTTHLRNSFNLHENDNGEWGNKETYDKIGSYDNKYQFKMEVTQNNGFPYHYFDIGTGRKLSEPDDNAPSTIDAAILCYGAMFARKYFSSNRVIDVCARALYNSINWGITFKNNVQIYHSLNPDGSPNTSGATSSPFNEYAIISYLANNQTSFGGVAANARDYMTTMLDALDLDPSTLNIRVSQATPTQKFMRFGLQDAYYKNDEGMDLSESPLVPRFLYGLSDDHSRDGSVDINSILHSTLSGFVGQFCYYLCHPLTIKPSFVNHLRTSAAIDYSYWRKAQNESFYMGCGAGASPDNYSADSPTNNPNKIVSPHVAIGYLPVMEESITNNSIFKVKKDHFKSNIVDWVTDYENFDYENSGLKYTIKSLPSKPAVLWRMSIENSHLTWQPYDLQLLDFSTELFGLATEFLNKSLKNPTITGANFFSTYNNIFDNTVIPAEESLKEGGITDSKSPSSWYYFGFGTGTGSTGGNSGSGSGSGSGSSGYIQTGTDTNSSEGTSTIVETTSKTGLSIYPIPNNGNFTVKMEDPSKVNLTGVYTIRIVSMEGIVRYSGTTLGSSLLAGTPLYLTTTLKTGYYIVEVSGLGMRERKSFIVNN